MPKGVYKRTWKFRGQKSTWDSKIFIKEELCLVVQK